VRRYLRKIGFRQKAVATVGLVFEWVTYRALWNEKCRPSGQLNPAAIRNICHLITPDPPLNLTGMSGFRISFSDVLVIRKYQTSRTHQARRLLLGNRNSRIIVEQ
jgi:hypothetical protein